MVLRLSYLGLCPCLGLVLWFLCCLVRVLLCLCVVLRLSYLGLCPLLGLCLIPRPRHRLCPRLRVSCGGLSVVVWSCVPCAARVFGDGWCFLVLRRWARAAGVDVSVVSGLLSSATGCVSASGVSVSSASVSASGSVSSPLRSPLSISAPGSGSVLVSSSVSSCVGAGFGARVRGWGARVGVGVGVASGGGVVAGWWSRACGRVSGLVSGVGVKGLVLLGLVGVVLLVSVLVLVGCWWFRRVPCVFVSWWRACVPRVRCAGCIKRGENLPGWFSPRFSCVERMTGLGPAAFALGGCAPSAELRRIKRGRGLRS